MDRAFHEVLAQVGPIPQPAQEVTRLDCMANVEHMSARVKRLEEVILEEW